MRNVDFRNADLEKVVFLIQGQINVVKRNRNSILSKYLDYLITWK